VLLDRRGSCANYIIFLGTVCWFSLAILAILWAAPALFHAVAGSKTLHLLSLALGFRPSRGLSFSHPCEQPQHPRVRFPTSNRGKCHRPALRSATAAAWHRQLNADLAYSRRLLPDRRRAPNQRTVPKQTGGCSATRALGLRFVLKQACLARPSKHLGGIRPASLSHHKHVHSAKTS
jgi:hypothetical protein